MKKKSWFCPLCNTGTISRQSLTTHIVFKHDRRPSEVKSIISSKSETSETLVSKQLVDSPTAPDDNAGEEREFSVKIGKEGGLAEWLQEKKQQDKKSET